MTGKKTIEIQVYDLTGGRKMAGVHYCQEAQQLRGITATGANTSDAVEAVFIQFLNARGYSCNRIVR